MEQKKTFVASFTISSNRKYNDTHVEGSLYVEASSLEKAKEKAIDLLRIHLLLGFIDYRSAPSHMDQKDNEIQCHINELYKDESFMDKYDSLKKKMYDIEESITQRLGESINILCVQPDDEETTSDPFIIQDKILDIQNQIMESINNEIEDLKQAFYQENKEILQTITSLIVAKYMTFNEVELNKVSIRYCS
jgi:hypothetical protein